MKAITVAIFTTLAIVVAPSLLEHPQAYGDDGDGKTLREWVGSQVVDSDVDVPGTLSNANEQLCTGNEHSQGCEIGGAAIKGATLMLGLSAAQATIAVILAVIGFATPIMVAVTRRFG